MAKKTGMNSVLDDGTEVASGKKGWEASTAENIPVYATGWGAGSATHFSLGLGVMKAAAEQIEGLQIGTFEGQPVIEGDEIARLARAAFIEKYDLKVPVFERASGNRVTKAQLEEANEKNAALQAQIDALTAKVGAADFEPNE